MDAGNIGLVIMLSGMFSSLIIGKVLDKTRKFKYVDRFFYLGM